MLPHEGKEHSENHGFHLRLATSFGLERVFGFEKDIQRPVHHAEVQSLFHPGFERSEDLIGGHWIIHCHLIAERPPSPDCLQNILGRDLPVFDHGYSTRTALTLPAVSAGNASLTTVRTPGSPAVGRSNAIKPWAVLPGRTTGDCNSVWTTGNPRLVFPLELVVASKLAVGQWD